MNTAITVETIFDQAEHLSFNEKLLLLEKLTSLVRAEAIETINTSQKPRVLGLREGQMWMADDFDAPLPDSFWLGEE